ncbi:MAG: aspartate carbamoyltransferase [Firmicutes bacterium]|nr:aspartate carbamoyltransferase [Bacillota bacterium]
MKSLIDIVDLSIQELQLLIETAKDISQNPAKYHHMCDTKTLATLFFEPSTRTRMSFEAAMFELGGNVISMSSAGSSSAAKGESVADTAKIVSCYADIIAMRHPKDGSAYVAASNASVPFINGGDGGHCHPTQTLADLLTIDREKGRLHDLTIGLCGDLKYGRTVHSLISAMCRYENIRFVLISPEELKVPDYVIRVLQNSGIPYSETADLEGALPQLDILYMTRIQKERFADADEYERLKNSYVLNTEKMKLAKADMAVLHPLPRVNEISVAVDADPRAAYFRQALNGKYMRMALILKLLSDAGKLQLPATVPLAKGAKGADEKQLKLIPGRYVCANPRCITTTEQELPQIFFEAEEDGQTVCRCLYCEEKVER